MNVVKIAEHGDRRVIEANAVPSHDIGTFPNSGNPNTLTAQKKSYAVPKSPIIADQPTFVYDRGIDHGRPAYVWGVALNGVKIEPSANEFFQGPGGPNSDWTVEALSDEVYLGEDCNNAHIQPNGEYHYHGVPSGLIERLTAGQASGSMILAGWAADGFPIYYAFGPRDPDTLDSELIELRPSYQLREGDRPGDGETAPDGAYSGRFVRDYVYEAGSGDLDMCNGRNGVTPEFPEGTYYYLLTDRFPFAGRCLVGHPSDDFKIGGANGPRNRPMGGRQSPEEILARMDRNGDGRISQNEARGRLKDNFAARDKNNDRFINTEELRLKR